MRYFEQELRSMLDTESFKDLLTKTITKEENNKNYLLKLESLKEELLGQLAEFFMYY